jgi:hypothetical protein
MFDWPASKKTLVAAVVGTGSNAMLCMGMPKQTVFFIVLKELTRSLG